MVAQYRGHSDGVSNGADILAAATAESIPSLDLGLDALGRGLIVLLATFGLVSLTDLLPQALQGGAFLGAMLLVAAALPVLVRWTITGSADSTDDSQ